MKRLLLWVVCLLALGLSVNEDEVWSDWFSLDLRRPLVVSGTVRVSPVANRENQEAVFLVDGKAVQGWTHENPQWDSTSLADGKHLLTLTGENASVEVEVLNNAVYHGGWSAGTWSADKIHVVSREVYIDWGQTLTIADGATVIIRENSGFRIESHGTLNWGSGIHLIWDDVAIPDNAFAGIDLAEIEFGNSVQSIGTSAFNCCRIE